MVLDALKTYTERKLTLNSCSIWITTTNSHTTYCKTVRSDDPRTTLCCSSRKNTMGWAARTTFYRVSELMADIDLGVATGRGGDVPRLRIRFPVGGTPNKARTGWARSPMKKIARLPTARPAEISRQRPGPRSKPGLCWSKRTANWSATRFPVRSNGSATAVWPTLSILPSHRVAVLVRRRTRRRQFTAGKLKTSTAASASNTAASSFQDVFVTPDRLLGGVERQVWLKHKPSSTRA